MVRGFFSSSFSPSGTYIGVPGKKQEGRSAPGSYSPEQLWDWIFSSSPSSSSTFAGKETGDLREKNGQPVEPFEQSL